MSIYDILKEEFLKHLTEEDMTEVDINPRAGKEVLGETEKKDYPLLDGKEIMVECHYKDSYGQAFTDRPIFYRGNLKDILSLDLTNTENRVLFISTLNAVLKEKNCITGTIHCHKDEMEACAFEMSHFLDTHKNKKIALIGYQPAIIDQLNRDGYTIRVLDLNAENIGTKRYGVTIEHGVDDYQNVVDWADLILCTGSTLVNGTITDFMHLDKPVYFFGNTIAGASYLLQLNRLCFKAH